MQDQRPTPTFSSSVPILAQTDCGSRDQRILETSEFHHSEQQIHECCRRGSPSGPRRATSAFDVPADQERSAARSPEASESLGRDRLEALYQVGDSLGRHPTSGCDGQAMPSVLQQSPEK
eukprot:2916310-Pyramimonas_sp.AAC.1